MNSTLLGVSGAKPNKHITAFREAMTATALLPEFKGNVIAVPTAPFGPRNSAPSRINTNKSDLWLSH